MRYVASVLLILSLVSPAMAADPAKDLADARQLIDAQQYRKALDSLQRAHGGIATLPESDREPALSAVHFYSALTHYHLGDQRKSRGELEKFLDITPTARLSNTSLYPRMFVSLFQELAAREREGHEHGVTFDRFYPGFDVTSAPVTRTSTIPVDDTVWSDNVALILLASRGEKREWNDILAPAARAQFIRDFWQRRDPDTTTEANEFRDAFERRVSFADRTFETDGERGALSDRGRMFVLLGAPSMVQRRALMNRDNVKVLHEMVDGTMELWVYSSEQLPIEIPKRAVQYRFVTQKGIGVGVLQRAEEAYATKVLAGAGEATIRR
ncbi:MAG TPA: GWxTD domain-containing protein [Thermoanaerobaculia bacterium]|nr:GWxTD domain-containing protein [Thermoanaerobaculia bacterium]